MRKGAVCIGICGALFLAFSSPASAQVTMTTEKSCYAPGEPVVATIHNGSSETIAVLPQLDRVETQFGGLVWQPPCPPDEDLVLFPEPGESANLYPWDQTDMGTGAISECEWVASQQVPEGCYRAFKAFGGPFCGEVSVDFGIGTCPCPPEPDGDGDGIADIQDVCPETIVPESVPTNNLGVNRWALVDGDGVFDTTAPPGGGGGPNFEFDMGDTRGCSCEQIIDAWALGWGDTKFGCSTGAMLHWIARVWNYEFAQPETESQPTTGGLKTLDGGVDDPFASGTHSTSDPGAQRPPLRPRRQAPRRDGPGD
jgi:hypothetical protein